jgi:signal transduction histidine kinase
MRLIEIVNEVAPHFQYTLKGVVTLAAASINFSIGALILARGPRIRVNQYFFLLTLATTMWLFFYALLQLASNEQDAYRWLSFAYLLGVPFISPAAYFFSEEWTKQPKNYLTRTLIWCSAIGLALTMFFFSSDLCEFRNHSWGRLNHFRHTLGSRIFLGVFLVNFVTLPCLACWNFFRGWRQAISPQEKAQYRYFLLAFLIGYTGAIDIMVAMGLSEYHFGFISITIYNLILAYAMIKHRFLNVNLLLRKAALIFLIYAILSALMVPVLAPIALHAYLHQFQPTLGSFIASSLAAGAFLSLGPILYAYLVGSNFWLKSRTSTGIAHELKAPLSTIESTVYLLHQSNFQKQVTPEMLSGYLSIIDRNAQRLREFINDLLRLAKIQNDDIGLAKTSVQLESIIADVIDQYKPMAQLKGMTISFRDTLSKPVYADPEKIRQTISNIISNALKFSNTGDVCISLLSVRSYVRCDIKDQGCGMSAKDLSHIFTRFYQAKNQKSAQGSGIGLTIAKAWVEAHGGKIWAESAGEGKGTTVTFTLPIE